MDWLSSLLSVLLGPFIDLAKWIARRKKQAQSEELSERERWMIWAANRNQGNIFTYSGLGRVPGGAIVVIGPYSSEKFSSESTMDDFRVLDRLVSLGYVVRVSKTKLVLTEKGKVKAKELAF